MRLSLYILLAGLTMACSPAEQSANQSEELVQETASSDVVTETANPATNTQSTAEPVQVSQVEIAPVEKAPATQEVKPDVELSTNSAPKTARPTGPTITASPAQANTPPPATGGPVVVEEDNVEKPMPKSEPDHSIWDNLLRSFVSSTGQVNYRGLKSSQATLDSYLQELESFPPADGWNRNQIMAYWINAYNAYTIKLILNNYPVNSIKDIAGGDPWNKKWIQIGGSTYSLNQIENDILRARYGDARIHFAVNCAAASCPPIHNRAFTAGNLNGTLQRLTRSFVNNKSYNSISADRIEISKIFEWYAGDFGNVTSYINGFTDVTLGEQTQVAYKEYNWALNGK